MKKLFNILNNLSALTNKKHEENFYNYLNDDYKINPFTESLKISIIYGLVGATWILLSDELLSQIVKDINTFKTLATFKGWVYVLITTILTYSLVLKKLSLFKKAMDKIHDNYAELSAANEELIALQEDLQEQFLQSEKHINALRISEQRYELAIEGAQCGIWEWDVENDQWYFSSKCKEFLGFEESELDNNPENWEKLFHPDDLDKAISDLKEYVLSKSDSYEDHFRIRCKNGEYKWIMSKAKAIRDEKGNVIRIAGSYADITEEKEAGEKLNSMAYHDMLTGLSNRVLFEENLKKLIKEADINNRKLALVYMDIDNFKNINDTLGHLAGDKLLKYVSDILKDQVIFPDLAARLGGDEFAIIFVDIETKNQIEDKIKALLKYLRKPWLIEGQEFFISFSIGISIYPLHGKDMHVLMKNSDMAMYYVKKKMKDDYCFYTPEIEETNVKQVKLVNDLRKAIDDDQFILYYQPIINLNSGELIGVEALIRWKHPKKGLIPPIEFIPLAEETGLIRDIEKWVLKTALIQKKQWENKNYSNIKMSINISGKTVASKDFIQYVEKLIYETNVSNDEIQFEVTETTFMEDLDTAVHNLNKVKEMGIKIALDDFGTGYSSLTYLKKLPIDVVKLDRGFIKSTIDIEKEPIVHYIIELINSLKLKLVAEGVETKDQLDFLKKYNCAYGQGYLFSKPIESKEVEKYFKLEK